MYHYPGPTLRIVVTCVARIRMKMLVYSDDKNYIEGAVHMMVTRKNPDKNGEDLIAAGIIDLDSPARAIVAHAIKGDRLRMKANRQTYNSDNIFTEKYGYRFVARPIDKLTHAILLHKSAVDEQLDPGASRILIIPSGGDVAELFLRRFAGDYNLPLVTEWKNPIWKLCKDRDYVQSLSVWTDSGVPEWKDVQAFEISKELTEDTAKEVLSNLLAAGVIQLPEGVTDAPAIADALQPDENGTYQVIDYLQTYAEHLATTIEDLAAPAHDLDRPIEPAIADMMRVPFPVQAHTVQAILNGFEQSKGVITASDMGTGKTMVSLATVNAWAKRSLKGFVSLVLAPGITIPKWHRSEIGKTLPNARVTVIDNWKDIVRYRDRRERKSKKDPLEFVLLSRDTAKLGLPKAPSLIYKHRVVIADRANLTPPKKTVIVSHNGQVKTCPGEPDRAHSVFVLEDAWMCPDCGGIQRKTNKTAIKEAKKLATEADRLMELKFGFHDLATGVKEYNAHSCTGVKKSRKQYLFKKSVTEYHCSECGANLMRDIVPEREIVSGLKHRRLQPSWFIKKYLRGHFDLAIVDELHQYKSQSGQGESMGAIVGASRRCLALTGTLSDGKASSLYHVLWRISPREMKEDGLDHRSANKFVHLYGAMEQRGRYAEDDVTSAGGSTSRKLILNPPREVPGLSPKLFVNHLANKTVMIELGDLGLPLVELDERPVFVNMDSDHASEYQSFHNGLETEMKKQFAIGNKNAFAKFIPSVVNAANLPHVSQTVEFGEATVDFLAPNSERELSAKERKLLEDIQAELAENRRCVVYVRYSGEAEQDKRIAQILTQHGIRARVLPATVSPEDRVEWLDNAVEQGVEVVVTNAVLVEVGLDLIAWPTMMFYQFTDVITTMRQAARRAWRISQHRACKVLYYLYSGTYELVQFKRMLAKRSHAMLLEGRLEKSALANFVEQDDKSASTFAIASCLGNVEDLANKWKALADKDIPAGVVMLTEERFKEEIGLAMRRLASETRRLAGVPEPVEKTPSNDADVLLFDTEASQSEADLPLFAAVSEMTPSPSAQPSDSDNVTLITMGEWRKQTGFLAKAKRAKGRDKVSDDQVLLFAL